MAVQPDQLPGSPPREAVVARPEVGHHRPYAWALVPASDLMALVVGMRLGGESSFLGIVYVVLAMAALLLSGSYRARISPHLAGQLPVLAATMALPLVALGALARGSSHLPQLLAGAPLAIGLVLATRAGAYALTRRARAKGELVEPTLVIGSGKLGVEVAETLKAHPEYGLEPVGFLDGFDGEGLPLPLLGDVHDLDQVLAEHDVRRVIVAWGAHREAAMVGIIRACDRADVEVHVLPRFFELGVSSGNVDGDDVWGIPLVRVRRAALRTAAWRVKRVIDVTVAGGALLVLSPVLAACAMAVRLTSPGPVLFRQRRCGQDGHEIEMLKFRTLRMPEGPAASLVGVPDDEPDGTGRSVQAQRRQDVEGRSTRVGRLLRRTSLDEVPQLWNVLRGDMSLVGPRPEELGYAARFTSTVDGYGDRHRLPVGLTGWAQIHGLRGDTSITERARFDNTYIEQWSLWTDMVIIFRTFTAVLREALRRG